MNYVVVVGHCTPNCIDLYRGSKLVELAHQTVIALCALASVFALEAFGSAVVSTTLAPPYVLGGGGQRPSEPLRRVAGDERR